MGTDYDGRLLELRQLNQGDIFYFVAHTSGPNRALYIYGGAGWYRRHDVYAHSSNVKTQIQHDQDYNPPVGIYQGVNDA
jgi:hypothetical protein